MTTTAASGRTDISSGVQANPIWRWLFYAVMIGASST